ncbi:MAG: hypothetical protein ACFB4I_20155 [Cyanophyceae cyanobacterium]
MKQNPHLNSSSLKEGGRGLVVNGHSLLELICVDSALLDRRYILIIG